MSAAPLSEHAGPFTPTENVALASASPNHRGRSRAPRSRGRGRGARPAGTGRPASASPQVATEAKGNESEPPAAETETAVAPPADTADDAEEEESCFICAEPISIYAISQCNHRTCHICSLRLRALYKTKACSFCKEESPHVVFAHLGLKDYNEYTPKDTPYSDAKLCISFETKEAMEDALALLRFNCPDRHCQELCGGWQD